MISPAWSRSPFPPGAFSPGLLFEKEYQQTEEYKPESRHGQIHHHLKILRDKDLSLDLGGGRALDGTPQTRERRKIKRKNRVVASPGISHLARRSRDVVSIVGKKRRSTVKQMAGIHDHVHFGKRFRRGRRDNHRARHKGMRTRRQQGKEQRSFENSHLCKFNEESS